MAHRGGIVLLCLVALAAGNTFETSLKLLGRMYENCESSQEIVKCFKIQAAKLVDRAARMETLPLLDGIALVRRSEEKARAFPSSLPEGDLNSLPSDQIDKYLQLATSKLTQTHRVVINPISIGDDVGRSFAEARGKLKKMMGPIIAGVLVKGGFLAIAFQAIALIAGKALLIGKIALLLSAIIGLKKLVSSESHEKTTYEIVKHPQVSQSHTYSSSHYGGDFDATGPGGHYRRSVEEEAAAQDRAYNAYAKKQ